MMISNTQACLAKANVSQIPHAPKLRVTLETISGMKMAEDKEYELIEEFRSIKRELIHHAFSSGSAAPRNRIMVTSINSGEGKSFVASNLAHSISLEQGKHCLLVDTNASNPSISQRVIPSQDTGLLNFLSGEIENISSCILDTNIPRLRVVPVGEAHELANEFLSGDRMNSLMEELNTRYPDRLVIFDAPHLYGVNESAAIAQHVDQIIIVISENETQMKDIVSVRRKLPEHVKVHYLINRSKNHKLWRSADVGK